MSGIGREIWIVLTYVLLLALGVFLIFKGMGIVNADGDYQILVTGILTVVIVGAVVPVVIHLMVSGRATALRIDQGLREHGELLRQIHEHTLLSDGAKRIAYRREEREMLRSAIEEDIRHEDWEAATVLVNNMAESFGYREEAEEFRARIKQARSDVVDHRLDDAVTRLQALMDTFDWQSAYADAARIKRLFPDEHRVADLEQNVRQAWADHKEVLERQFLDAASEGHVDEAMELLKELDQYLSPREAEPYQEVARGVIGRARENLGLQFKMAIQDHEWTRAVHVGERIIGEFPNTLMAREVRERIDVLREKAAGADIAAAEAAATTAASLATGLAAASVPVTEPGEPETTNGGGDRHLD